MHYILLALTLLPSIVLGATAPSDFKGVVALFIGLIDLILLVLIAFMVLATLWGVMQGWIVRGGEAEGVTEGKRVFTAGVIGIVVATSLWGIVNILQVTFFGG